MFFGLLVALWVPGSVAGQSGETHEIEIKGLRFPSKPLEVVSGDVVSWLNADIVPHTVTADGESGEIDWTSDMIEGHGEYRREFTEPGRIEYRCVYHPEMIGVIVVRPARERTR